MDNEAFRALVEERAKPKSTKEIAREAVEEEFRTRNTKRKRGGGGGSSSEDNDSDNDNSDREDESKHQKHLVPAAAAKKKARAAEHDSKYRDRAKERREGKNVDYQGQASLMEGVAAAAADEGQMDQVTISKYLGGDEAHTHLVKGLDVALARRVKREIDMETTETKTATLPSTTKQTQKATVLVRDATEARLLLQNIERESMTSELGRQMLNHMKQVHMPPRDVSKVAVRTSPAGLAIQRSTLTFSTIGNAHDRNRAWELPLESLQASVGDRELDAASSNTETTQGTTLLDSTLLYQIKGAFERHLTNAQDRASDETEKEGEEENDEDIFNDADDAYKPPTQTEGSKHPLPYDGLHEDNQSKAKGESIFAGLTAPKLPQPTPGVAAAQSRLIAAKHEVISRDVLGSMANDTKTRPPTTGISIASYEGGYGEEMDVDFDGRFADEDEASMGTEKGKQQKKQGRS